MAEPDAPFRSILEVVVNSLLRKAETAKSDARPCTVGSSMNLSKSMSDPNLRGGSVRGGSVPSGGYGGIRPSTANTRNTSVPVGGYGGMTRQV